MPRIFNIPLRVAPAGLGTANANSNALSNVDAVIEAILIFPPGTNNNLIFRLKHGESGQVPATGESGGVDFAVEEVPAPQYVGDGIAYSVPIQFAVTTRPIVLILQSTNNAANTLIGGVVYGVWQN